MGTLSFGLIMSGPRLPMSDDQFEESEGIDLDEFDPPDRPDFRRIGRGIPFVVSPDDDTKRVRYSRSSKSGNILDDESNLTDWKLRTVVFGASQRPELMAAASVLDPDTDKKELRTLAEKCLVAGKGERRAVTGTAIHAMFDHLDRGTGWKPPPQFEGLCDAYQRMLDDWGLIAEDIEVHCVNDHYGLAGCLDRRYRTVSPLVAPDGQVIPIGSRIVGDIKTGAELEYASGSYVTQLTAYVDSLRYDVTTDQRSEWFPESVSDWALIIHANSAGSSVDVYWADLIAGREGLALARMVKKWRRRKGLLTIGKRLRLVVAEPLTGEPTESVEEPEPVEEAESHGEPPTSPGEPSRTSNRHEYLRGRVRALREQSEVAAKALQLQWPRGVPGLKNEGHTWDQLELIYEQVLDIEKRYSIAFYPEWNDPAIERAKAIHPSNRQPNGMPSHWTKWPKVEPLEQDSVGMNLLQHKRQALIRRWLRAAIDGDGIDSSVDQTEIAHALYEFGKLPEEDWPDDDLTTMLDGSLRAIGYANGVASLGRMNPDHGPLLMSAAFAIAAGNGVLLFDENGKPVVRTNVRKA
jgi:hypothetical protein